MRIRSLLLVVSTLIATPLVGQRAAVAPSPAPPPPGVNSSLLVSAKWLAENLAAPDVVVLQVGRSEEEFSNGHVPGAVFLPLSSIVVEADGIPNELPPAVSLQEAFEAAGVSDDSHVILYGDLGGLAAARAFFTLEYLGHTRVSLLDGGLEAWRAQRRPVSTRAVSPQRGTLHPRLRPEIVVDAAWVRQRLEHPGTALIDARPSAEYSGEVPGGGIERPGHIPGARNMFWRDALRSEADPRLLDVGRLQTAFSRAGAAPGRTVVTYCRTGVQASHAYFVARYLGFDARMYDGSFIDWSRRTELPVSR
jgi:thiosulfate/3-mercaptopyruvate sulfurtransferase